MENEREIRLRQQIEELVRSRVGMLEQDISRLQREVNESFTRLLERTDAASSIPDNDDGLSHITAEVAGQIGQASKDSVRATADIALLRDSVAELDQQQTQAEVLNALVSRAANFAPRIVLFVVKGSNALAWAARGLEDGVGNTSIRGLSVPLQSDTALRAALSSQETFYGSVDQQSDNAPIVKRLGNVSPERILTVPLRVRGKAAAVLYADSADRGDEATNVEAIELLVNTAGLVVELVSLRARKPEGQPAGRTTSGSLAENRATTSGPLTPPSAALQPPHSSAELRPRPAPAPVPAAPTPVAEQAQSGNLWSSSVRPSQPAPAHVEAQTARAPRSDEEEKMHNDARRFARLLVSEIKLYNEQKVVEGRANRDLYDRLREDIDRSRQMYDKRVTPEVSTKVDYFYDELVNTLAEGDAAKLGAYPT
ncbi:MAG TPA: GAF domain-containing protein [Blastocatellia bacterium]|nr:GAF domain-containing protein [Blastocatellia bacterium]